MDKIHIEFPADRQDIAAAMGRALTEIGQGHVTCGAESVAAQGVTEPVNTDPSAGLADGGEDTAPFVEKVDENGVPFDPDFCSAAASPFYRSGKKKGQWKRKQGVDEGAYDEWYAGMLTSEPSTTLQEPDAKDLVAGTFAANDPHTPPAEETPPQNIGEFMKWVSEHQVAGRLKHEQVTDAYTALGLPLDALVNPSQPTAQNCAAIYYHLKAQISP